ncbi:hypothetical protein B0H12DRAFT_221397 [Mycena haematopus]|nr:hypothetical protein B0H12DRAFT_221397 [Mycena haematopus]
MAEKTNAGPRSRRRTRPICWKCQVLKIRCEYKNLEDDCEQCKSEGSRCRYFQSAEPDEVEVILEEVGHSVQCHERDKTFSETVDSEISFYLHPTLCA